MWIYNPLRAQHNNFWGWILQFILAGIWHQTTMHAFLFLFFPVLFKLRHQCVAFLLWIETWPPSSIEINQHSGRNTKVGYSEVGVLSSLNSPSPHPLHSSAIDLLPNQWKVTLAVVSPAPCNVIEASQWGPFRGQETRSLRLLPK